MLGYGIVLLVIVAVAFYSLFIHRRLRRQRLAAQAFPEHWHQILERDMALYHRLPSGIQAQVRQNTLLLMDEVNFYGCAGLEVTEQMRVLICAHAGLLISGLSMDYYQSLRSILIYPGAYRASMMWNDGLVHGHSEQDRLGESWEEGRVILGWDQLKEESADASSQTNVLLHEFAHQLDQLDGDADGAPPLGSGALAMRWQQVFSDAWHRLQGSASHGESIIDPYGATDPAEFFAVATEAFFLAPADLRHQEPDLYQCLEQFYGLSPASWRDARQT